MYKLLLTLLLSLTVSLGYSQSKPDNYEIESGPVFNLKKNSAPRNFVGRDKSGIYLEYGIGSTGIGEIFLAKFDNNLELKQENLMTFKLEGGTANPIQFMMMKDNLYQLSEKPVKNGAKFYVSKINKDNLSVSGHILIASVDPKTSLKVEIEKHFSINQDSSLWSLTNTIPTRSTNKKQILVTVVDSNMKKKWSHQVDLPYVSKRLDIHFTQVDGDGNVHMLCKRYDKLRSEKNLQGEANYDYLVLRVNNEGKLDSVTFDVEGNFLRDVKFGISKSGNELMLGGFYSERDAKRTAGIFYAKYNGQSMKENSHFFKEFDADFLSANLKERKAEKVKKKLDDGKKIEELGFSMKKIFVVEDGSTYLIGEQVSFYTLGGGSPQNPTPKQYWYEYKDIALVKINGEGKFDWAMRIGKDQHTVNDFGHYSSFGAISRGKELCLFFNDNSDNLNHEGIGRPSRSYPGGGSLLTMVSISTAGEVHREGLVKGYEVGTKFRPTLSLQLSETELLMFGQIKYNNQRIQRFVRIRIN
jgi:hypothetical protein